MATTNLKLETVNIGDVEITEAGKYNGVPITEKDLDEMIQNFDNGVTEPYITIDHSPDATAQFKDALKALSLGFVSKLWRQGGKLLANFKQVPKQLAELIEAGPLKKKSIEFYKKYLHADGSKYENVLQGVTFHGANGSPAVTTLSDFLRMFKNELSEIEQDTINQTITLKDEDNKKGEIHMSDMTITKEEYSQLTQFKVDSEKLSTELTELKATNQKLEEQMVEFKTISEKLEKTESELTALKKANEDAAEKREANEAESYIDSQIEAGILQPAVKELYLKNYRAAKADGEESLKLFKTDIESRNEDGIFENADVPGDSNIKTFKNEEELNEMVKAKMKADGIDFMKAREIVMKDAEMTEVN
jgi:hypothetical protein